MPIPGQIQCLDPLADRRLDAPTQPDPRIVTGQPGAQLGEVHGQRRRQQGGGALRILDRWRCREDGLQLDRGREQHAAHIGDLAALGRDLLVLRQLVHRHARQPVMLDDLPPDQARADAAGDEGRDDEQEQGTGSAVGPGEHRLLLGLHPPRGSGRSVQRWLVDGLAKVTAFDGSGIRSSCPRARFDDVHRRASLADLEDELLLFGPQLGELRLQARDLVAGRRHMARLAQVEERQACRRGDRDQRLRRCR